MMDPSYDKLMRYTVKKLGQVAMRDLECGRAIFLLHQCIESIMLLRETFDAMASDSRLAYLTLQKLVLLYNRERQYIEATCPGAKSHEDDESEDADALMMSMEMIYVFLDKPKMDKKTAIRALEVSRDLILGVQEVNTDSFSDKDRFDVLREMVKTTKKYNEVRTATANFNGLA